MKARPVYQWLALRFAVVGLVPVLLVAILVVPLLIENIQQDVITKNIILAKTVSERVRLFLDSQRLQLSHTVRYIAGLASDDELRTLLDQQVGSSNLFEAVYLVDKEGRVTHVGLPEARRAFRNDYLGLSLVHRTFVKNAWKSQQPAWSNTFLSVMSGRISLALAFPLSDNRLLVGDFNIDRFSDLVYQINKADQVLPIILDQRGNIIAHPNPEKSARQINLGYLPVVAKGIRSGQATARYYYEEAEYIGSAVNISGPNWAVLVAQPTRLAFRDVWTTIYILIFTGVGAVILALVTAMLMARRFSHPFELLTKHTQLVGSGDYEHDLPLSEVQEINQLRESYRGMVGAVQNREQQLAASEQQVRLLLNSTAEAIYGINLVGECTFCNPALVQLLGYQSADQLLGKNMHTLIHHTRIDGSAYPIDECLINQTILEAKGVHVEDEVLWRADGSSFPAEYWSFPMYRDYRITGAVVTFVDITERKNTELELSRLRSLLSNIINSMPSALVCVDDTGKVTQWNLEAERISGINIQAAHGHALNDIFPQMAKYLPDVHKAILERQPRKANRMFASTNGEDRLWDVTVYPLLTSGAQGAVIRVDDVTEQARMQEMIVQSEKMLSVGGLAAGMAHEINNPLAGILQNIQVIQNRLDTDNPKNREIANQCGTSMEEITTYLRERKIFSMADAVMASGKRAAKIVDNMLSFSRKSGPRHKECNLAILLDKTIQLAENNFDLKKKYDFRGIKINRHYDASVPDVKCEDSKIQQVFLNILMNGAESMLSEPNESTNEYTPCFDLRISWNQKQSGVLIEISDNGQGMDEITRRRVFEPFFTTKSVGSGTGLGMSIAYFIIVENHGGTMTVESTPGFGSRFIIELPLGQETKVENEAVAINLVNS
ncbi:PAS domain S-box protein [Pseudomonadota bacterium]